jgi:hypothetical protein
MIHSVPAFLFARLDKGPGSRLGKNRKFSFVYKTAPPLTSFAGPRRPKMLPSLIQRISAETVNRMVAATIIKAGTSPLIATLLNQPGN